MRDVAPGRPPASISAHLEECLGALREIAGFLGGVVSRADGLVIKHTFNDPQEAATTCALAVATVGSSRATASRLGLGEFDHAFLICEKGVLVLAGAGEEAVLACLLHPQANLGMAMIIITRVAARIEGILAEV